MLQIYYTKNMKKLLWIILTLFTIEVIAVIGYNWLAAGYTGDATLTLSKYVGLNLWSCIFFGITNLVMIILFTIYALHQKKLLQTLLLLTFNLCYLILSICPHLPVESAITQMHQIFAITLFVAMLLIGISLYNKNAKLPRLICGIFILFGLHFLFAYANQLSYFMDNILYWEVSYIYLFISSLITCSASN